MRPVVLPIDYLHLDQVIGILGPKRVICYSHLFPYDYFRDFEVIRILRRDHNANLICLGKNEIIAPASNLELIRVAREEGVYVHEIELSEFAKGVGGPNCMILPIKRG